jgi:hypothetical protein
MPIQSTKRNDLIDLLRFVSCLFVVLSHCPLPGILGTAIIAFGHYAVPFFLMISGWYSVSDDRNVMLTKAKKQLCNTLKLIAVFFTAYFIMNSICGMMESGSPFTWVKNYSNFTTVLVFLLFNRALFLGSSAYYIFMLLYVYIIFIICIKHHLHKYIMYAAPGLLVITILCGEYAELPWYTYGNFLFTGMPCFAIGHLLHKFEDKMSCISSGKWMSLFVLGVFTAYFEAYTTKDAFCYFGSVLMAVSLLMVSVRSMRSYLPRITQVSQKYSTIIFIMHCGIRDILKITFWRLDVDCPEYLFPFVVIITSLLVCIVWDKAEKQKNKR